MTGIARFAALVLGAVLLCGGAASAQGKLDTIATFSGPTTALEIATYTADNGGKAGAISIVPKQPGRRRVVFGLDGNDVRKLREALVAARDLHGPGHRATGVLEETGTTDQCVLVVHGGTSLEISIVDPEEVDAEVYAPSASDLTRILGATDRLASFLGS